MDHERTEQAYKERLKQPFGSFSWLGVPYNPIDLRYAAEALYEVYSKDAQNESDIMRYVLEQNERVVSRCGMLIGFSGTLIALLLFVANKPQMLPFLWQQWIFYLVVFAWSLSTMALLQRLYQTPNFLTRWGFPRRGLL